MDIEQFAREGIDQHRGHDAHPSGHHHGFNTFVLERAHQVVIHLLSACKQAVVSELAMDPQALGSITGSTAGFVHDEDTDLGIQVAADDGVVKRFEIGSCS